MIQDSNIIIEKIAPRRRGERREKKDIRKSEYQGAGYQKIRISGKGKEK